MTAKSIVTRMLEDGPVDPDDPNLFLDNYRDAFERMGFSLIVMDGRPTWYWKGGEFGIEVVEYTQATAADLHIPYVKAMRAGATAAGYLIWSFLEAEDPKARTSISSEIVKTEKEAVAVAARFLKALARFQKGSST